MANGSEPWRLPSPESLPEISVPFADESQPCVAFARNPETLARTQAIPGQVGLQHRIGGLEKDTKGPISYDSDIGSNRYHPQPGMQCAWCQFMNECMAWLPGMTAEDLRRAG